METGRYKRPPGRLKKRWTDGLFPDTWVVDNTKEVANKKEVLWSSGRPLKAKEERRESIKRF